MPLFYDIKFFSSFNAVFTRSQTIFLRDLMPFFLRDVRAFLHNIHLHILYWIYISWIYNFLTFDKLEVYNRLTTTGRLFGIDDNRSYQSMSLRCDFNSLINVSIYLFFMGVLREVYPGTKKCNLYTWRSDVMALGNSNFGTAHWTTVFVVNVI